MSDELDQASELEMLNTQIALANRQRPTMTFTGACHYCEEKVDKGFFCCPECKDDYERIERAAKHRRAA
ncbi:MULTISPECIES: hypothetical protein [unclassified Pantoea]|uniref:hypothetical protein n=1 Tax=unclassified Pantoea TaxID=2630326 RepID=UPI001C956B31|nr:MULTISPECIES: hypothetical protein [unclassified Pantoea]MBY4887759.1 hypothetical protein [Pantoea sp. DY-15]MEA5104738.1 hypothetical protein [Pantoea sp. S18]